MSPVSRPIDFRVQPPWRMTDEDPESIGTAGLGNYERLYGKDYKRGHSLAGLTQDLRRLDMRAVVQSEPVTGTVAAWNDQVRVVMDREPELFPAGFCCADPRDVMGAIREIDRCRRELDLRGLTLVPDFYNIDLADKRCYPLIAKAVELGMPVGLHVGVNFTSTSPIRHGHPQHVDEIACHFPEAVIICNHGGWPWAAEMVAVAWKHKNIYLEFGAIAPKYLGAPDGGWMPMRRFMNTQLQDRILFGSDWPMMDHDRLMSELSALALKDSVMEKYLRANAEALLDRMMS
ncbi:MAG TPA: amidohydrolase family protein [Xanthobacteraceae bacterium]|nr:amidohydrolase family protein [Xanthobacteraceae bacterium]